MIKRNDILMAGTDATIEYVSELGEITLVHVPPGRQRASSFVDLAPEGYEVRPAKGVTVFPPRAGVTVIFNPGHYKSDANPDFQPMSQAEKLVQEMRQQVNTLRRNNRSAEARARGAASVERIPTRDDDPVVLEAIPTPPPASVAAAAPVTSAPAPAVAK